MKRIDVVKKRDGWAGQSGGRTVAGTKAPTKAEAVNEVAPAAQKGRQPVSVRIHTMLSLANAEIVPLTADLVIPVAFSTKSAAGRDPRCFWLDALAAERRPHQPAALRATPRRPNGIVRYGKP